MNNMEDMTRKEIDALFRMVIEVDSRLTATHMILADFLKQNEEQQDAFFHDVERTKDIVLKSYAKGFYEQDQEAALRIFGDLLETND